MKWPQDLGEASGDERCCLMSNRDKKRGGRQKVGPSTGLTCTVHNYEYTFQELSQSTWQKHQLVG